MAAGDRIVMESRTVVLAGVRVTSLLKMDAALIVRVPTVMNPLLSRGAIRRVRISMNVNLNPVMCMRLAPIGLVDSAVGVHPASETD